MTDLVVGASGQVGSYCMAALPSAVGTYNTHPSADLIPLDVRDAKRFEEIVGKLQPRVMYLSGCLPEVDYCEANPEVTHAVNVIGVRNAVEIANLHRCKVVYVSSEYLFDGAAGPYDERAPANPLSVYGWQKLAAEHYVAAFARDWLIIRTAVVYSRRSRFIQWLRGALSRGETVKGLVDQISTPTYAPDLAVAMIDLAGRGFRGVFNICGSSLISRYEFARAAAQAFGFDPGLVAPARTSELKQRARRPLRCGLAVDKVQTALGRSMMDPAAGLRAMT